MTTRKKYVIDFEYEEVLGPKIRRLIQAGCAVVADCPTCLRNGVDGAREAGASAAARNFALEHMEELGLK
jgi:hypothetical protein